MAYQNSRSELLKYATAITGDRQQAEDILQDEWLRCTAAAVSEQIREPIRFLFRVVRNLALDYRRRRTYEKRYINVEVDDRSTRCVGRFRRVMGTGCSAFHLCLGDRFYCCQFDCWRS
ncbi:sigma factor [Acetobacter okinawensis]|uniref:sigma factor n=1 Tax=Acetobacter okinawensis TaxID=1076594 RepID=UPI0009DDF0DC